MVKLFGRQVRRRHVLGGSIAALLSALIFTGLHNVFPSLSFPGFQPAIVETANVPHAALEVFSYAQAHGGATQEGYVGGRVFYDDARSHGAVLPHTSKGEDQILYREYDVRPKQNGMSRGAERVVIGSDGSAYYSSDHYQHFKKFR